MELDFEIEGEINLRDIPLTEDIKLSKGTLIRWICLTTGLLSPNERKRETIVKLLEVIVEDKETDIDRLIEKTGMNQKSIYYNIKRLEELGLIERKKGDGKKIIKYNPKKCIEKCKERFNRINNRLEEAFDSLNIR